MKPFYQDELATLYLGDCRELLAGPLFMAKYDVTIADPPYGDTKLEWDERCEGWLPTVPSNNLWCFGSFRFFFGLWG